MRGEFKSCFVYYPAWGMQCCGDPIHVGDTFEQEVVQLKKRDLLKKHYGADYYFDKHGNVMFSLENGRPTIKGTVKSIWAIWEGKDEEIITEIDCADSSEDDFSPNENMCIAAYLIELTLYLVRRK